LTQAQLATAAGREAIARLETGAWEPSWATVQALAEALGVDCRVFQEPKKKARRKKP
jgi:transcriptional regulator with XRE-family HTH domain